MSTRRSLLPVYRLAMRGLGWLAPALLNWRLARGKEDPARMREKTGIASLPRPAGHLAWLHGASVGESISLLPLVEQLAARGLTVLVTTGTVSSARILADRLGPKALHQYAPLDVPRFVERFLAHWRPDLVLIAESEIWPNLFCATHSAGVPLVMVSARLSERSFGRWQRFPATIASILSRVDLCLAQTHVDSLRLRGLGAPRVQVAGNLKYDVPALPADSAEVAGLEAAIGARPVWIAASTHAGEEAMAGEAHRLLAKRFPDLLTIIAPRHVARAEPTGRALAQTGLRVGLRSQQVPVSDQLDIYMADTMGELGLFYRLSNVVYLGKSADTGEFVAGGQNPIEPSKLGNAILHGPLVENFAEVYSLLDTAGGGLAVANAAELADGLAALFADRRRLRAMARAAQETVHRFGGASARIMLAMEPYLMQMQIAAGRQTDVAANRKN